MTDISKKLPKETLALFILLTAIFGVMVSFSPKTIPAPWFDEGWTLAVARNLVEQGKYARQLGGDWVSATPMAQPFSITLPVAASLRFFGVGVLQGRIPGILSTIGTLALIFVITRQLYGLSTGWVTLFILLCLIPDPYLHPMIFGRQAIGEMPMLFYLLLGYWYWKRALSGSNVSIILSSLFWGLAIISKRQTLPFWLLAWIIPLILVMLQGQRRTLKVILITGLLTGIATISFIGIESWLTRDWPLNGPPLRGLYSLATFTWSANKRLQALLLLVIYGPLSFLGLLTSSIRLGKQIVVHHKSLNVEGLFELSLFILAGSWYLWYILGSLNWLRYYFPAMVLLSPFAAKTLTDWLEGFNLRQVASKVDKKVRHLYLTLPYWKAMTALALIVYLLTLEIIWIGHLQDQQNAVVYKVADYINQNTAKNALIETYESELYFLLQRPYHYPPDQIQIDLNRRSNLSENIQISYNPLLANPDYLIVGPLGKSWQLYDPFILSGDFQFEQEFSQYKIYSRTR